MYAIPQPVSDQNQPPSKTVRAIHASFLKYLPAVTTHARIQFRHLPAAEREEAIAEATAAALLNLHQAHCNGKSQRITPNTLAHYAVLHVKDGRHVGGSTDSKTDVMSRKAQRRLGFKVVGLPWNHQHVYDCLCDPTSPVWKHVLLDDKNTPVLDQVAFRIDWSMFLGQRTDRTRKCLMMLAAGYKRYEVADGMGTTPPAVTQRMARVERDWDRFQGILADATENSAAPESCSAA